MSAFNNVETELAHVFFKRKKSIQKDDLARYRKIKNSESRLVSLDLDKPIHTGVKCGNCNKVFRLFSEIYVEEFEAKVPCCPYCRANVLYNNITFL